MANAFSMLPYLTKQKDPFSALLAGKLAAYQRREDQIKWLANYKMQLDRLALSRAASGRASALNSAKIDALRAQTQARLQGAAPLMIAPRPGYMGNAYTGPAPDRSQFVPAPLPGLSGSATSLPPGTFLSPYTRREVPYNPLSAPYSAESPFNNYSPNGSLLPAGGFANGDAEGNSGALGRRSDAGNPFDNGVAFASADLGQPQHGLDYNPFSPDDPQDPLADPLADPYSELA